MASQIFLNGEFIHRDEAKLSVFDHGLLYGDGIFEGIRVYDGNVFKLAEHIRRLYDSAKSILLDIPYSQAEMCELVCETVRRNDLSSAYIRLVVTRGPGDLGISPYICHGAQVFIIAEQLSMFAPSLYEEGITAITAATRRNRTDALNPKIKSLNYLNNVLIKIEAQAAGANEAIVLNTEGYVVEGSGENIFIVRDGVLSTPPAYLGALEGITRGTIVSLAHELGYQVKEEPFTRHDVYVADEVFLTGTAAELVPVVTVDKRTIGDGRPGPVTRKLHQAFQLTTRRDGMKVYPQEAIS
ncbi:branched-chain-amino-acid transaminase [Alicyclobacillus fastidiosus]|uniref:Branched-chain-amino-acid aminotransferase n=1 Tax=Alicyclobacillus fastidiosus TaxID=392011 RepID=A0ABY6ZLD8_9BACL|nr:branched-chain-amino-acid transaminase [Alicyclobacillus fastidiosus]WAH43282.1 branched-chain-amino-acid transaminase [Alicyclobacillus fastidiosus]GMA65329.1 branched chain amino acid aminotransferase [Alicyclobacillus fastidiosus]